MSEPHALGARPFAGAHEAEDSLGRRGVSDLGRDELLGLSGPRGPGSNEPPALSRLTCACAQGAEESLARGRTSSPRAAGRLLRRLSDSAFSAPCFLAGLLCATAQCAAVSFALSIRSCFACTAPRDLDRLACAVTPRATGILLGGPEASSFSAFLTSGGKPGAAAQAVAAQGTVGGCWLHGLNVSRVGLRLALSWHICADAQGTAGSMAWSIISCFDRTAPLGLGRLASVVGRPGASSFRPPPALGGRSGAAAQGAAASSTAGGCLLHKLDDSCFNAPLVLVGHACAGGEGAAVSLAHGRGAASGRSGPLLLGERVCAGSPAAASTVPLALAGSACAGLVWTGKS